MLSQGYQPVYIRELTGHTYKTIRKYKSGDPGVLCKNTANACKRTSILDNYANIIVEKLNEGMILKDIFKHITSKGYGGKQTNFYDYCKRIMEENNIEYHTSKNIVGAPINKKKLNVRFISRSDVFDFIWLGKKLGAGLKNIVFNKYPVLYEIHASVREFREIFNTKSIAYLNLYIDKYKNSDNRNLKSFAIGLLKDIEAIENAVSSTFSNGYVEGNNNRLKMIKRIMYGRAGLPLLKAKILYL